MAANTKVVLRAAQQAEIFAHCLAERPNEACGLVAGRDGRVERVFFTKNVEKVDRQIRYEIDPAELLQVFRTLDDEDLELVGIFHSHVRSPARPSATDVRLSYYPDAVYLLISLQSEPEMKAYHILKEQPTDETGEIVEVELVVEP